MKRNCNLELCLFPSSDSLSSNDPGHDNHNHNHNHNQPMMEEGRGSSQEKQQQQQLTIFYNGKICVYDVTEFQARTILLLATREMEERLKTPTGLEPSSPSLQSPLCSPNTTDLFMKSSLQRFLQKRKLRIQATSPYNH
uniref:Protein TIFY n=1 Tax=Fagus sylvatica TaxID=28930 RepID=A0A2N9GT39_FAGSY